jgi:hypothetical protein
LKFESESSSSSSSSSSTTSQNYYGDLRIFLGNVLIVQQKQYLWICTDQINTYPPNNNNNNNNNWGISWILYFSSGNKIILLCFYV